MYSTDNINNMRLNDIKTELKKIKEIDNDKQFEVIQFLLDGN